MTAKERLMERAKSMQNGGTRQSRPSGNESSVSESKPVETAKDRIFAQALAVQSGKTQTEVSLPSGLSLGSSAVTPASQEVTARGLVGMQLDPADFAKVGGSAMTSGTVQSAADKLGTYKRSTQPKTSGPVKLDFMRVSAERDARLELLNKNLQQLEEKRKEQERKAATSQEEQKAFWDARAKSTGYSVDLPDMRTQAQKTAAKTASELKTQERELSQYIKWLEGQGIQDRAENAYTRQDVQEGLGTDAMGQTLDGKNQAAKIMVEAIQARELGENPTGHDAPETLNMLRMADVMTDRQKDTMLALAGKGDWDGASRYLSSITDQVNQKAAKMEYENMKGWEKGLYWIPAGLEQFGTGISQLGHSEVRSPSVTRRVSQMVQQDAYNTSPALGFTYDMGTSISNMTPSILLSMVAGPALGAAGMSTGAAGAVAAGVGSAALGASAGGNAYAEKKLQGYGDAEAAAYATLVGISEAGLQYVLGGISKLGATPAAKAASQVVKIDNALGQAALRLGANMLSEGTEEGLQAILEPAFATLILDEKYQVSPQEVVTSFIMGALTAGILEGPSTLRTGTRAAANGGFDTGMDGYLGESGVDYFRGVKNSEETHTGMEILKDYYNLGQEGADAATANDVARQYVMRCAWYDGQEQARGVTGRGQETDQNTPQQAQEVLERVNEGQDTQGQPQQPQARQEAAEPNQGQGLEGLRLGAIWEDAQQQTRAEEEQAQPVQTAEPEGSTLGAMRADNEASNIQNLNEGAEINGRETEESSTAEPAGRDLSDGGQGRVYSESPGQQTGGLEEGPARARQTVEPGRATGGRKHLAENLRGQEVSSRQLGLSSGTDTANVLVVPQEMWEPDMVQAAQEVQRKTGAAVTYVLGNIEVAGAGGGVLKVKGVQTPGKIIVQADHPRFTVDQIAAHETFHDLTARDVGMVYEAEQRIKERYNPDELGKIVAVYTKKLRGIVDIPANATPDQMQAAELRIWEELCADAYAGMNAFEQDVSQYQETVREVAQAREAIRASRENAQATERTTGPTSENEVARRQQDIADVRERLRDAYAAGEISEAEYDAAMDAVWEQAGVEGEGLLQAWDRMDEDDGWGKFSKDDEEILTETEVGDDGNIYLPGGPVPEAVKRMRAQQEDRSQKAGGPERFFTDKTDGLMNRMTQEEIRAVQSIGSKSINDFAAEDFKATEGLARRYWVEMGEKSPFFRAWFGDWRVNDQTPVERATELGSDRGQVQNKDTGWTVNVSRKVFEETKTQHSRNTVMARHYLPYINDIVKKAVLLDSYTMEVGKEKSINSLLMHSMYAVADIGNGPEVLKLFVEEMNNPNSSNTGKRAYKLLNIKRQQPGVEGSGRNPSLITQTADIKSVADLFEAVKRADRNFRPGVSSKVVDEDGRPMAVYHGTDRGFWSFDPELDAYWFSKEIDYAQAMAEERGGERVLSAYISMKDPMYVSLPMGRFTDPAAEGPYVRKAKAEGRDGIIFHTDTDNPMLADTFYAVFRPEQIKSATDNIGTFDPNNSDIRYSMEDEEMLTETEVGDDGNIYLPGGPVPEAVKRRRAAERGTNTVERNGRVTEQRVPDPELTERYSSGDNQENIVDTLPKKAQNYLSRAERAMVRNLGELLSVPTAAQREYLQDTVREISEEYLRDGRVSQETADRLFEDAYAQGVMVQETLMDEYRDLYDRLRSTDLVLAKEYTGDIPDFEAFRKKYLGRLKISTKGRTNIDQVYMELMERWPQFFGPEHTHPSDQLEHIAKVMDDFRRVEMSLDDYYGRDGEFKRWAKHDFEVAVTDMLGELRNVKRYADEQAAAKAARQEAVPTTQAEVEEAWRNLKTARRTYEKANAKNLLTNDDRVAVGRLLRGEIQLKHLDPDEVNVKGVKAVYEARVEYERLAKGIKTWNRSRKEQLMTQADHLLETANDWKDKKAGILYSRETMERNVRDIVKDRALAEEIISTYFTPVHQGAAAANRTKNTYRERVRELGLSRKVAKGNLVSEAHAVQLLGEAEDNIRVLEQSKGQVKVRDGKTLEEWNGVVADLWKENPNLDRSKIRNAIQEFRTIYDELFQQMNEVRVRNGYEPVNYRQGYFPHFQPGNGDGIMAAFGRALGISTEVTALPTTINGLTHTFRPGIRWFGNAQERLGFNTAYDAVEGFDRYIEGVADVIHQTDNIQRLRALASQIRYRTGDEGIRRQVDAVRENTSLPEQDKQNRIEKIYKNGRFALSNFVVELDEYTNILANKKSRADRNMEQAVGRWAYNFMKAMESRVAANMVAINPGSWLTNFIPLTQGGALLDRGMLLHGMWDTLRAYKGDDGFVDTSTFLTNRRGSDPLVKTWTQKASAAMSKPMEYIDCFTADSLVRARYRQNLAHGMSEDAAMTEADAWTAGVMADRSKGSMPTLFERKNPLTKVFTQFQLEVNNQLSYLFKDMPRDTRDKGLHILAAALIKFALGAFLYNEIYEYVIGRRPALDPIGILNDTVGDLTGWELPNLVTLGTEAAAGELTAEDFRTEQGDLYDAAEGLAGNVAENLPFISGFLGGGRYPVMNALPDFQNMVRSALDSDWDTEKKKYELSSGLENPLVYLFPPFGGGQLKKIYQGIKAAMEGGKYSVNSDGEEILQYPMFMDSPGEAASNLSRALLFGTTSLPTGQAWVEGGFKSLTAEQTAAYKGLLEAGIHGEEAYDLILELRGATKTETTSKAQQQRDILSASELDEDAKSIAYYAMIATDREREIMDIMEEEGADMGKVTQALMAIKSQGASSQDEVAQAIRTVSGLNNTVRGMLWQLQNKSWKTKNNPFSESAGYRVKTNYEDPEPLSLPTLDD